MELEENCAKQLWSFASSYGALGCRAVEIKPRFFQKAPRDDLRVLSDLTHVLGPLGRNCNHN